MSSMLPDTQQKIPGFEVQRFFFGITTVLLTSAFFTQMLQDQAAFPRFLGIDWKIQFCLEIAVGTVATFLGVMRLNKGKAL